jgi:hypothetical protein
MSKFFLLSIFIIIGIADRLAAQETLPNITVKNQNGIIIVSWRNEYPLPVKTINIQRSFDSLKNYSTIGSVLNPQNRENGFADVKPPYNKMYYRVFISFDGGAYQFSEPVRPVKDIPTESVTGPVIDSAAHVILLARDSAAIAVNNNHPRNDRNKIEPKTTLPVVPTSPIITYPSRRIYTGKDNNIIINLPEAATKKYQVKFFDENENPLFDINKIPDNYLIIEKVNFIRSGWYYFELYENGKIIEKNKFFVPKDGKQVPSKTEQGKF